MPGAVLQLFGAWVEEQSGSKAGQGAKPRAGERLTGHRHFIALGRSSAAGYNLRAHGLHVPACMLGYHALQQHGT